MDNRRLNAVLHQLHHLTGGAATSALTDGPEKYRISLVLCHLEGRTRRSSITSANGGCAGVGRGGGFFTTTGRWSARAAPAKRRPKTTRRGARTGTDRRRQRRVPGGEAGCRPKKP
jgi:hypothetical protein